LDRISWISCLNSSNVYHAVRSTSIHAVVGQDRSPLGSSGSVELGSEQLQCFFRDCCQEDCCGINTSWNAASGLCIRELGSTGFDDTYTDEYEFGCIQRGCCESDCCADGTQYNETSVSCTSCTQECNGRQGKTSTDTLQLPPVFGSLGLGPTEANSDPHTVDSGPAVPTRSGRGRGRDRGFGRFPQEATEDDDTGISRRLGVCVRLPFGPGKITLLGCDAANLNNMAIIPEIGVNVIFPPVNNKEYDADGMYFRGLAPIWWKVPDHCSVTLTCLADGTMPAQICCNVCASVCFGTPGFVNGGHGAAPPNGFN
jgi:hypothetical protein